MPRRRFSIDALPTVCGRFCGERVRGVRFVLHGPRSLRPTAIREADRRGVLGDDAGSERFLDVLIGNPGAPAAA